MKLTIRNMVDPTVEIDTAVLKRKGYWEIGRGGNGVVFISKIGKDNKVKGNSIPISEPHTSVNPRHLGIRLDDFLTLRDLGSRFGSVISGRPGTELPQQRLSEIEIKESGNYWLNVGRLILSLEYKH